MDPPERIIRSYRGEPPQPSLFEAPRPMPTGRCDHCHAEGRKPVDDCLHDLERDEYEISPAAQRPAGCLNRPNPETDSIPY